MKSIHSVAKELLTNPELLQAEMAWLCSDQAKAAMELGEELGRMDSTAQFLDLLLDAAPHCSSASLVSGYIQGLLETHPHHADAVNAWLDENQEKHPQLAFEIAYAGGAATKALERALSLVDAGRLPVSFLYWFVDGVGTRALTPAEVAQILQRMLNAIQQGDPQTARRAISFVAYDRLGVKGALKTLLQDPEAKPLIRKLLEATVQDGGGVSHVWTNILRALIETDPEDAIGLALRGLLSDSMVHQESCHDFLTEAAGSHPELVMGRFGDMVLSDEDQRLSAFAKGIFLELPVDVVSRWLEEHGVEGARRIARHLPAPFMDEEGNPVVPPNTAYVLKTFEKDSQVFQAFCAGVHAYEMFWGDLYTSLKERITHARKFLNHPLRRIREWAALEIEEAKQMMKQWEDIEKEAQMDEE
ncbi:MAG: hypothetical protein L3J76_00935 [Candidatus Hydrothermae bacterium]|nr:hypothetical protein [Candidatus Hydrothermae bacterium]